jgi:hypothetical protein
MSLGESRMSIRSGGGQSRVSADKRARSIVFMDVSPSGTPNTVYRIGDQTSLLATLDVGPLSELIAKCLRSGLTAYVVPVTPSVAGGLSTPVTQSGTGTGTVTPSTAPHKVVDIQISAGGILGTGTFKWRVGGVGSYSAPVIIPAGGTMRIPGTFCTPTFPAGTYVLNESYSIGIDGTITRSGGTTGPAITQASSPLQSYEVLARVVKAGALGSAVLRVSLDNGISTLPDMGVPASGKVVLPNTGVVLTCASTFTQDDTYSFLACQPGFSTSDVTAAFTAARADRTIRATLVVVGGLPSTAAGAISLASTVETQLQAALATDGLDWQAIVGCPTVGDIVMSGANAIRDAADTDAVVRTAREGQNLLRTAVCPGTHRQTSALNTGAKLLRPFHWGLAVRYVDTDPRDDLAALEPLGPLDFYAIVRDESSAQNLDDVQYNVARTYRTRDGVFLAITANGFGWKNMTTDAAFQDAGGLRALNSVLPALRDGGLALLGQRPPVNPDGTLEEKTRRAWSKKLDGIFKREAGLMPGGAFTKAQASLVAANILASSQLGQSPRRLDIEYTFQTLGFVSDVNATTLYSGVITVEAQ